MGKKDRAADAHKLKEEKKSQRREEAAKSDTTAPALGIIVVFAVGVTVFSSVFFHSEVEGRTHFVARLFCFMLLETSFGSLFPILFLAPARAIAARLPGGIAADGTQPWAMTEEESISNDEALQWPGAAAVATLPVDWQKAAAGKKQPFFLNHVRGGTRLKQTGQRLGSAVGSLCTIATLSLLVDRRPVSAIGILPGGTFAQDLAAGVAVGCCLIGVQTLIELRLGWVRKLGYCEVADPAESLGVNLLIDAVFHVAVSLNEEVPLRGWLLQNMAEAGAAHFGLSRSAALLAAVLVESLVFAWMHYSSPGATWRGLLNLTLGGLAAATNLLLTGSLAFSLGWHWGWNFTMGNLCGRSTSGIPISATLLAVAPHPAKAKLHGGTFGPEGGVLAAPAYVAGLLALYLLYGTSRWHLVGQGFPLLAGTA